MKTVKPKKPPLRWRKVRVKIFMTWEVRYELRRGWHVLASMSPHLGGGWCWYSRVSDERAAGVPLEQAKTDARAAVLKWEREQGHG